MSRHSLHAVLLCGALGFGLAGVNTARASDARAEQSQQGLRVTYLLYSGRPNPVLLVTDPAQVRAIEEQLSQILTRGERVTKSESPSRLGYTGIQIERLGAGVRDSAPVVLRGDVLSVTASTTPSQQRASREVAGLESVLLELAREQKVLADGEVSEIRQTR
ncbi:hypothetical protein JYJ95_19085 [Corallococcus exiguus]|uniref:hypothetical protein n=1 Tax=Corallococcus exiguus TaxID=83462 RepID=UPI001A8C071B|nr:hypothetical protein [Corallococcus exiguus]MBN8468621.1 hypothetical protein [Corallococcus exiguus]